MINDAINIPHEVILCLVASIIFFHKIDNVAKYTFVAQASLVYGYHIALGLKQSQSRYALHKH